MKGYFAFDWSHIAGDNRRLDFRFLFKPTGTLSEGDLSDAIESSVAAVLFPDVIAIICIADEVDAIKIAFNSPILRQAANRASNKVSLCICSFDEYGRLSVASFLRNNISTVRKIVKQETEQIVNAGLTKLFSASHVLVNAPPGFAFVKPSGERSTHFLRAEEALTEIEGVQFLSFALLSKISARDKIIGRRVDVIYIDSMAIASVAYALRDIYCTLHGCPRPRVVSFHSHDGLSDPHFGFPLAGTSFCVISASSSMNMEQKWKEKSRCHPAEVITLLTLKSAKFASDALYFLQNPHFESVKVTKNGQVLKDLRITGERFSPEEIKPKQILLKSKEHSVEAAKLFSKYFSGAERLTIQGRGANNFSKTRPIFLDGKYLLESQYFTDFLKRILAQKTPASLQAIIHQDDASSLEIAKTCSKILKELMVSDWEIPCISQADLEAPPTHFDTSKALLIVAGVIGRGSKLLSISRDLRSLHTGARIYIIGAQVAETQAQILSLKRNLMYSAEKSHIAVERFSELAVGAGLSDFYNAECDFLNNLPTELSKEMFEERTEMLCGSEKGMAEKAFLPFGPNLENSLKLRADFAYWPPSYNEKDIHVPAVYATVGAILQHARESDFESSENRLGTDAFQQVVLSPENFSRYNDGVIQAALLRAGYSSELDYSSESFASQYMRDFLIKVFEQHERPQGEASLDFALALRLGRLKIMKGHYEELKSHIKPILEGDTKQKRILRIIFGFEKSIREKGLPNDF